MSHDLILSRRLRITGIEVPKPGFRPTEQVEETGRRLREYANSFGVPFDYQGIAKKRETIRVEDLQLRQEEVVIANCLYRFRNLVDETLTMDSPREGVDREGHFWKRPEISCEGSERVERPETYKTCRQWQIRNLRTGFEQLPLDPEILNIKKNKVKELHHKNFVIDEDSKWLLQGWKGRIVYAMSTWKPSIS
ncbi:scarecrow-like protein 9 [Carex littledalei]|uniref:Scarecrow-like protein 9 n=1 Tax=Carex littledalei TaxID=544730 RepID=A0A833QZ76_9POAL|nr:scarecrow-like protein 9 [Carex littledalei]